MRINKLSMRNYRTTAHRDIDFTQILVISGVNGTGKSSVYDAVAWGVWGRTISRDTPTPSHQPSAVTTVQCEVQVGDTQVIVQRKTGPDKGDKTLFAGVRKVGETDWSMLSGETQTKLQAKVEEYVGDYDTWRRTCVFMSDDIMSSFAASTDAARKEILEGLLDLTYLDKLATKAKAAAKTADAAAQAAQQQVSSLSGKLAGLAAMDTPTEDHAAVKQRAQELSEAAARHSAEAETLRKERKVLEDALAAASYAVSKLKRDTAFIAGDGTCSTCGQAIPEARMADITASMTAETQRMAEMEETYKPQLALLKEQEQSVWRTISAINAEVGSLAERARAADKAGVLAKTIDETMAALAAAQEAVADAKAQAAGAALLSDALGKRGVRAAMLADVATALGLQADHYLQRLSTRHRTALKIGDDGVLVPNIVDEHGSERIFKSYSVGERKRIAVAFLLALAELSERTRDSTLIIDEAFDGLDSQGVQGVIDVVADLAESRPLVLLSHVREVLASVPATTRLHIEPGEAWTK